jgi:hypothetical protein
MLIKTWRKTEKENWPRSIVLRIMKSPQMITNEFLCPLWTQNHIHLPQLDIWLSFEMKAITARWYYFLFIVAKVMSRRHSWTHPLFRIACGQSKLNALPSLTLLTVKRSKFTRFSNQWMVEDKDHFMCIFSFNLLCWVGVRCGIYESSYNISNISHLNLPPHSTALV